MSKKHQSRCKVCLSPNLSQYNEKISVGASTNELADLANEFGEDISNMSFQRHRDWYLFRHIDETIEGIPYEPKPLTGLTSLDPVTELRNSLSQLDSIINLASKAFEKRATPAAVSALASAFDKRRNIIESVERLDRESKERAELNETIVLEVILEATENLCPRCVEILAKEVTQRLKEYGTMEVNPKA